MAPTISVATGFLYAFSFIIIILFFVVILLHSGAIYYSLRHLYLKRPAILPSDLQQWPGISIIKPLTTIDAAIFSNLESYFKMDYPTFELLFCFQDIDDSTLMLLDTLRNKYPVVDCQILVSDEYVGVNPKINNMNKGYLKSKYDLTLISDCGIFMEPTALKDMVMTLYEEDRIGMVHQVPWMIQRPGFANVLQTVFFGTWHAKLYVGAACYNFTCTSGMSCLMRKSIIDEAGGLATFAPYLAEDYFLARHFYCSGWKIRISHQPAWQNPGSYTVRSFHERVMRWYKLRVAMLPHTFILEPLTQCLTSSLLSAFAFSFVFQSISFWVFFMFQALVWLVLDYILLRSMSRTSELTFSKYDFFWAWCCLVVTSPYLQLKAMFSPNIVWREKRFRIRWGGLSEEILKNGDELELKGVLHA